MDGRITTGNRNPGNYALPVDNANGKAYYMETYTASNKKLKDDTSVLNAIKIDFSKFTAM